MSKSKRKPASTKPASENQPDALFGRVVSILEQARGNVVRAVNTQMVLAYWLIGREIVQELQGGKARANYGERVVEDLSARLTERFGKGFSTRNVKLFKQFYLIRMRFFGIKCRSKTYIFMRKKDIRYYSFMI